MMHLQYKNAFTQHLVVDVGCLQIHYTPSDIKIVAKHRSYKVMQLQKSMKAVMKLPLNKQ